MQVTKEEFEVFISNYPRPLEKNVDTRGDPAVLGYHDFSLSKDASEARVARHRLWEFEHPDDDEKDEYFIDKP